MTVEINNERLEQIVKGEVSAEYEFFAFKILLTRLQNTFKQEPEKIAECITELSEFCNQHEANPQFSSDLEKISE